MTQLSGLGVNLCSDEELLVLILTALVGQQLVKNLYIPLNDPSHHPADISHVKKFTRTSLLKVLWLIWGAVIMLKGFVEVDAD